MADTDSYIDICLVLFACDPILSDLTNTPVTTRKRIAGLFGFDAAWATVPTQRPEMLARLRPGLWERPT